MLRSHVWLYPRIIVYKSHGNTSMFVDTVINFANCHILRTTYYVPCITYRMSDHIVSFWTQFRRDKNHTNQYLNFWSHHPLHHKLAVVRTLTDQMEKVVTEKKEKKVEDDKIRQALKQCGYPDWMVKKVKQDRKNKQNKPKAKKSRETPSTHTSVTIPYIQDVMEKIQHNFRAHQDATAVKPYLSLIKLLVHPKDKTHINNTTGWQVIWDPLLQLQGLYWWNRETFWYQKEHQDKAERLGTKFTRATRKDLESKQTKFSIADPCRKWELPINLGGIQHFG